MLKAIKNLENFYKKLGDEAALVEAKIIHHRKILAEYDKHSDTRLSYHMKAAYHKQEIERHEHKVSYLKEKQLRVGRLADGLKRDMETL